MKTWAQLHLHEPASEEEVKQEILWDNKYIQINQKPLRWKKWREQSIVYVNDLLHSDEPRFLSHTKLGEMYNLIISFLETLQSRAAIPCGWKRKIVSPANRDISTNPSICTMRNQRLDVLNKSSKMLYSGLVKELMPRVTSQGKWNEIFP